MSTEIKWIEPIGGLGDALMLSSVIKLAHDRLGAKYNMVRRTRYAEIFAGHPAIDRVDYLPKGARVQPVTYWHCDEMDNGTVPRAFQMLAKMFGLELPVPETMYLPMDGVSDGQLAVVIPWRAKNVAIAPDSTSPRKMMAKDKWGQVAKALSDRGALAVQFGENGAEKVKYAYSLAGVTTPKEAIMLLKRMDLLITSDNFLMHAAHLTGTPVISLWGPTEASGYGYPEQQKIIVPCRLGSAKCIRNTIGTERTSLYISKCQAETPCMDSISAEDIIGRASGVLWPG